MKYKVLHIILLFFCCTLTLSAQELSVKSFRLLENDLTANTHATMVKDRNGEVAALIKVVTTEQGFMFDGGMTGIVLIKQGTGEVWVYVPHGIKRINIQHQQFGVLRDYYFPIPIEKARTYELVLATPKVETVVEQKQVENYNNVRANFFVLRTNEPKASIYVDGYPYQSRYDGSISGMLPYGEHTYQVKRFGYETAEGTFTIDSETVDFQVPQLSKHKIPRWYVQGWSGVQYDQWNMQTINNKDLIWQTFQLGLGYNFNIICGARLIANGWKSYCNFYYQSDYYEYSWNYISPIVDFTVNLSNLFLDYNPNRQVNFSGFAGIGANIAFNNDEVSQLLNKGISSEGGRFRFWDSGDDTKTLLTHRVGVNADCRISNNWSIGVEFQCGSYDIFVYYKFLLGLKYTFGQKK